MYIGFAAGARQAGFPTISPAWSSPAGHRRRRRLGDILAADLRMRTGSTDAAGAAASPPTRCRRRFCQNSRPAGQTKLPHLTNITPTPASRHRAVSAIVVSRGRAAWSAQGLATSTSAPKQRSASDERPARWLFIGVNATPTGIPVAGAGRAKLLQLAARPAADPEDGLVYDSSRFIQRHRRGRPPLGER